ncbi:hypothetical protein A2U01_0103581, partial [Trifolium medium]|nr:hypothetical protein [Trifolium medium]
MIPVKTEPFDVIWISSDDEGDNVAKRFAKNVANNVDKRVNKNVAQRIDNRA